MRGFVPDQFHEGFGRFAFNIQHDFSFQLAEPVVRQKKGNEDHRQIDRHKPFIADVARRIEGQPFLREFAVKFFDERLEFGPFQ